MIQHHAASPTLRTDVPAARGVLLAVWGLALVEAVIGYEWLLSALNKLLNPRFRSGLAHMLHMSMPDNPHSWYVALRNRLAIPHAQVCATLGEVGELLVALGLFTGAGLWLSGHLPCARWARRLNRGVIAALLGGALMTANYDVMAGNTLPGLNPGDPFGEGLGLDGLLIGISAALLAVHLCAGRLAPSHADTGWRVGRRATARR